MLSLLGFLLSPTVIKIETLVAIAFLPSVLYMRWIRNAERYNR
jgi:hypothetical protein